MAALSSLVACNGDRDDSSAPTTNAADGTGSTTAATSTLPAPPSSAGLLRAACDGELVVSDAGQLPADLTSVSGLAASRRGSDLVWAIEDSLEPADVVALAPDGTELGRVRVQGGPLTNLDWEDLAISSGSDGVPTVYVADVGDNLSVRPSVQLYVFPEPEPNADSVEPRVIRATFDDSAGDRIRPNVEALVVQGEVVWALDKSPDGPATLFRLQPDADDADRGTFVAVSTVDLPGEQVTAVDLSPDGTVLALRTTDAVRLYPVPDGGDVADTLAAEPCSAPPPDEGQGESLAIMAGDRGLLTVSEDEGGEPVTMHRIAAR